MTRIIGLDPGLQHTGWGIIDYDNGRLTFVAAGHIDTESGDGLAVRLAHLDRELSDVLTRFAPAEAAVEETFVNRNPLSALKLGQARGVVMVAPARLNIPVAEYSANTVKKTIVGAGHAAKEQIGHMVGLLLPGSRAGSADEADALAVAICHAHHRPVSWPQAPHGAGAGKARA